MVNLIILMHFKEKNFPSLYLVFPVDIAFLLRGHPDTVNSPISPPGGGGGWWGGGGGGGVGGAYFIFEIFLHTPWCNSSLTYVIADFR
jgi:hypothetical protein